MLQALFVALLLAQDPKPAAKTVEERLKELTDKIEALDKKAAALTDENAKMQAKVQEANDRREAYLRQGGEAWVKRYGTAAQLSDQQSADIKGLFYAWAKEEMERGPQPAAWKEREQALRAKLTPEQATTLAGKIREDLSLNVKTQLDLLGRSAKLDKEKLAALEKAVRPRLTYGEGILLPQAHPDQSYGWPQVTTAAEASLGELTPALTETEVASLRQILERWTPKKR